MNVSSTARLATRYSWVPIVGLLISMLLPFLVSSNLVHAATVTARSIDMSTSQADVEASYTISFTVPDGGAQNIGSFAVEFCDNDPLPNTTCTFTSGDNVPDLDATDGTSSTAATLSGTPSFDGNAITLNAPSSGDNVLDFDLGGATTTDPAGASTFTVTVDSIDNPSNVTDGTDNNGFYARVYVYSSATIPAIANPISSTGQTDEGGIALSTAEVITLDARVQETLNFCVGTIITTDGDCSTVSGNTIDLGVIDQSAVTESDALDTTAGTGGCDFDDTNECAVLVVSTNATNAGVDVDYITNSGFQVGTGVCDTGTTAAGPETDQCLNPAGGTEGTETVLSAGSEAWGQAVVATTAHAGSTTTNNLVANIDADYDHGSVGYAIDDGGTSIDLADSNNGTAATNVVDREQMEIAYAATAAITTPAGAYQVQLVYIATGTF